MEYLAPAPWSIDPKSEGRDWTDSLSIIDAEGGEVAILTRGYEGDTNGDGCPSYTNARLIAAAPDLLAALQNMVKVQGGEGEHDSEVACFEQARAVIAKATKP